MVDADGELVPSIQRHTYIHTRQFGLSSSKADFVVMSPAHSKAKYLISARLTSVDCFTYEGHVINKNTHDDGDDSR